MKTLPNFMIIGAGKSGTTSLYEYLKEHPQVFMSPVKETNFFALEGKQLVDAKNDPNQMNHYPWSITVRSEYEDLFKGVDQEKAIGEVSPMYLYTPVAARKIKATIPNVKIVVILRNPVDRLYSRFLHLARENRLPTSEFSDALDQESIWWKRNDLVREGHYFQHLSVYFELFDEKQIKVFTYDELRKDPKKVIADLYEFIGVDATFEPDMSSEYNVSGFIKNKFTDKLIGQDSLIKKAISKVSPALGNAVINNTKIKKWVNGLRNKNLDRKPLDKETRQQLLELAYKEDIHNLHKLLKIDFSNWLNTPSS